MRNIHQFAPPTRGIEARYGYFLYNQNDSYVGKSLELYGEYCEQEVSMFRELIKPTDVIWEVGANIGSQTIPLSQFVPSGEVIAFEPQLEIFKLLCANLSINNCENVTPLWMALGDIDGETPLPEVNYQQAWNFGAISLLEIENPSNKKVVVNKIDSLKRFSQPNFIKIDVEGMELMVLKGALETISNNRPLMYIENNGNNRFGEGTSESLIQMLWDLKYRMYWHVTYYFNRNNYFTNKQNIFGRTVALNMVCVPVENDLVINENEITEKSASPV